MDKMRCEKEKLYRQFRKTYKYIKLSNGVLELREMYECPACGYIATGTCTEDIIFASDDEIREWNKLPSWKQQLLREAD
jgi:hypothetical protein